jgi:cytochrome o ubiquinol oxidase subunit 1
LLQLGYSIWKRKENRDLTGDPWDGRTLEWSISSPAPEYNFAVIPTVHSRDAFWVAKQSGKTPVHAYEDIHVPKNTPLGMFIAAGSFLVGFGIIWHIWVLAIAGLVSVIFFIILRSMDENTERVITAAEVERTEVAFLKQREQQA